MIIEKIEQLPDLSNITTLCIDVETTSFKDKEVGGSIWKGARQCGIAISTCEEDESKRSSWYLPIRHRSADKDKNLPLKETLEWFNKVLDNPNLIIINHNIKFDAKMWWADGGWCPGKLLDTKVLARLVYNDLFRYSLDFLSKLNWRGFPRNLTPTQESIKKGGKGSAVKAYLKAMKYKDYALCNIPLLGKYALIDVNITVNLYWSLIKLLPKESFSVWETEIALTKETLKAEIVGMPVDESHIKKIQLEHLTKMLDLHDKINDIVGREVDVNSDKEKTRILIGEFNLEPQEYTKKSGEPSWNHKCLAQLDHPIGPLWAEYSLLSHFHSLFCEGWRKLIGSDKRLHGELLQAGTKTGRFSSRNPNLQNASRDAECFIPARKGYCIVGWDYSQMEYRIFAHYANDKDILGLYKKNPNIDFHQMLADELGIPRPWAKEINFSMIYGMGKPKLLLKIRQRCLEAKKDIVMRTELHSFLDGSNSSALLTDNEISAVALKLYNVYHQRYPSIRNLTRKIFSIIRRRKNLKNWKGRYYQYQDMSFIYKGPNELIQGSSADIMKEKLVKILRLFTNEKPDRKGVNLLTTVHDSIYLHMPIKTALEKDCYILKSVTLLLEDENLRVPLLVDCKISAGSWGTMMALKKDFSNIREALVESLEKDQRKNKQDITEHLSNEQSTSVL